MLKRKVIAGIKWSAISAIAGNVIQLAQLVIVSHLLIASDFGMMALTLIIIYFSNFFCDFGISNSIIYKQHVSATQFSSLFWTSTLLSLLIIIILVSLSSVVAAFYQEPALKNVIRISSVYFIFLPLQMQYQAFLKKELHFKKLAISEIVSKIISFVVAVVMALKGYGVFALVYSTLAGIILSALMAVWWGWREYPIKFRFHFTEIHEFLKFGVYQTGDSILNFFHFQIDSLLVGKLFGINAVGIYSFAKNLALKPFQIINPILTQVSFPVMAKVNNDKPRVKIIYSQLINYLSSVNFLIYPFIAAFSEMIIRLFFGEKWLQAVPVLQALSLYCMLRSVLNPVGALLYSQGFVKHLFYWNLLLILFIPGVLFLSSFWGMLGLALSLSLIQLVLFIPAWWFLIFPACGLSFNEYWKNIRISLAGAVVLYLLLSGFNFIYFHSLATKFVIGLIFWGLFSLLFIRLSNKQLLVLVIQFFKQTSVNKNSL